MACAHPLAIPTVLAMLALEPFRLPCALVHRFFPASLLVLTIACACVRQPDVVPRAVMLADKGRYEEAAAALSAHLHTHPRDVRARRLLIRMHGLGGHLGKADAEAKVLARELGPSSPLPWIELGSVLELAHRYDEALERYDQAAVVAPKDPLGPRTGGLRAARWGEHEAARPRLEEALRRDPKDAVVWHALGLVCLGLRDLPAADRAYRSGLVADPTALENRVGLATLALIARDPAGALAQYDAILRLRPKHADAMLGRAWALAALDRLDEAERALREAASLGADRDIVRRQARALAEKRAGEKAKSVVPPPPAIAPPSDAPTGAPAQ
jgi:tetratricopeptide (TPR) repeat protein